MLIVMDKRKFNGGAREGAGRKPAPIKNKLIQRLDAYIDDTEVIKVLGDKIKQGDMRAIKLYFEMRWGKPTTMLEVVPTIPFQEISFQELLSWEGES